MQAKKAKLTESEGSKSEFTESEKLLSIENELCARLERLEFTSPIDYTYNPLKYAKNLHETFVKKYFEKSTKKILFLGMNPGPWGMCQNGIPFGEINHVKEWFKITGLVEKPDREHPKRTIMGLNCHRSECSGKKFWSFFKLLCGTPENFFKYSFVYNFCPLAFLGTSGCNITPSDAEFQNETAKKNLIDICENAFINIIKHFKFEVVIAVGRFSEKRARKSIELHGLTNIKVVYIPHPSCRNARNIKDWEQTTFKILQDHNMIKYFNETTINNPFLTNITSGS